MPEEGAKYGGISMAEYCDVLFRDLGYHESSQRRGWLKLRFNKSYLDEMDRSELYRAVQLLRAEKYGDDIE
jgi:hypothetical protein